MGYRIISTVVTAATKTDLVTLATVKEDLEIQPGNTSSDAVLTRYIRYASQAIQQYCNRLFAIETIKDEFFFDPSTWPPKTRHNVVGLTLSKHPVTTVASVIENGQALSGTSDYRIDKDSGLLTRLSPDGLTFRDFSGWPVSVQYEAGFESIPVDVEDACLRMIRARFISRSRDPNIRSESIPGVRDVSYWVATGSDAANMTPDVADLLDNYRMPVVA